MKKKFLILTIVVALVVVFALVFSSCSAKKKIDDIINGGATDNGIYPSADYDTAQIEQKLNEMKGNGVYVKIRVTDDGEDEEFFAYGAKGEVYFFQYGDSDDQMWLDLSNNDYFVEYDCEESDTGALVWTKNVTHYNEYLTKETLKQTAEAYASTVWANLGFYANLTGEGTKTQITMLGRSCDKYVVRNGAATVGASVGWTIECVVDKATGVCLKYAISAEATTVDGHETASFAIEATEFNASWTPTLPTVAHTYIDGEEQQGGGGETPGGGEQGGETPGGEGGQGEVIDDSDFAGKRFVAMSVECTEQSVVTMFSDAHADLFANGKFELVSGMGVLFGTYRVRDNDRYANLETFKGFGYESQAYYHSIPRTLQIMAITREGTDEFRMDLSVPISGGAVVDAVVHMSVSSVAPTAENLPNDPNGDIFNAQYQVEQYDWDFIFDDRGLLAGGKRFTVARTSDDPYSAAGTFKVDRNKIEDSWAQGHIFYDKTGNTPDDLGQYAYDAYMRESNDTWYSVPANYSYEHFDEYLGIVPVPFARLNYSSTGHYYYINLFRWTETGSTQEKEVQNYKVWFVDGNVQNIEYNTYGTTYTHTFNYSAYNTTTVELPEIDSGQPQSANIDDCYDTLEDTVLAFNRVSNAGDYAETYTQVMQGATIYIFDDHTFEMHVHKAYNDTTGQILDNMEFLYYGTFALTGTGVGDSTRKAYASGALTTTQFYVNGSLNQEYTPSPMNVMWYVADNELRVNMDFYGWFALTNDTPTRTPVPTGGGEDPGTDPGTDPPADTHVYISTKYPAETQEEFAVRMMDLVDEDGLEFAVSTNNGGEETTLTYKLTFDDEKFVVYVDQDGKESVTEFLKDDEEYFYVYSFDGEAWSCDKVAYVDAEGDQTSTMMSIMNDIFGMLWIADNYRDMEFDSVETRQGLDDRDGDCYELETDYYSLTIVVDQETGAKFLLLMQDSNGGLMLVQRVTSFKTSTEIPAHEVEPGEPAWDEIEYIYQGYEASMNAYILEHYAIEDGVRKVYFYHLTADGEPEGAPFTLAEVQANASFGCTDMSEQNFAWSFDEVDGAVIVTKDGEQFFGAYVDEYDSQNGIGILGDHFNFEPDEPAWDEIEYFSQFMSEEEGQQYYIVEWFYKNGDNNLMKFCSWEVEDMPEGAPFTFAQLESEREAHHQEWGDGIAIWQYDEKRNAVILLHDGEPTGEYYLIDGYDAESGKGTLGKCLYEPQWNKIGYIEIYDDYEGGYYHYTLNHYAFDEGDRVIYSYYATLDEELDEPLTLAYVQDENNGFDVEKYGNESWCYDEDERRLLYLWDGLAEGYLQIKGYDEEQGVGILENWAPLDYSGKEFFMQYYNSSEQILRIEYFAIDGIVIQYLKEDVTEEPERLTLAEVQSDEGFVESNLTDVSGASWSYDYDPNGEPMITVIYDENEPGDSTVHWGIMGYDIENDIVIVGAGL